MRNGFLPVGLLVRNLKYLPNIPAHNRIGVGVSVFAQVLIILSLYGLGSRPFVAHGNKGALLRALDVRRLHA